VSNERQGLNMRINDQLIAFLLGSGLSTINSDIFIVGAFGSIVTAIAIYFMYSNLMQIQRPVS
jgi:hypothetical protein